MNRTSDITNNITKNLNASIANAVKSATNNITKNLNASIANAVHGPARLKLMQQQ